MSSFTAWCQIPARSTKDSGPSVARHPLQEEAHRHQRTHLEGSGRWDLPSGFQASLTPANITGRWLGKALAPQLQEAAHLEGSGRWSGPSLVSWLGGCIRKL